MKLGNLDLGLAVVAAPMAGISDQSFRIIAREMGADLVVSEMVSCKGLIYNQAKSWELLAVRQAEQPIAVQLFGSVPAEVAQAAAMVAERVPCVAIDINMGCPTPKITRSGEGAALLENPVLAAEIVRQTVRAVKLPVSVKTRKSWDEGSSDAVELARRVEDAGAAFLTIHGRTRQAFYSGSADWDIIGRVKQAVGIPVVGNGDIVSGRAALRMIAETGCDAVMVGRAALGNPWLFAEVKRAVHGGTSLPAPDMRGKLAMALRQLDMTIAHKGEYTGIREMRKHLVWYIRGLPRAAHWRDTLNRARCRDEVVAIFTAIIESGPVA